MAPPILFANHQFVQVTISGTVRWLDPGYGVEYVGATQVERLLDFDDNYLDGYYAIGAGTVLESGVGIDLNGNGVMTDSVNRSYVIARKNLLGTREVGVLFDSY